MMPEGPTLSTEKDTSHPLDPLSAEEITRTVAALRSSREFREVTERIRFITVSLREPTKDRVMKFPDGGVPPREAEIILLDYGAGKTYEAIVSLDDDAVTTWRYVPGVQPASMVSEIVEAAEAVKRDPRFVAAIRRRGVTDMDQIQVDPWPAGNYGIAEEQGIRLARAISYHRPHPNDNGYAHPIEGLVALIDLNHMEVLRVDDHEIVPIPPEPGNYVGASVGAARTGLKPLEITQPEGPSFEVEGWEVRWQRWRIRVGFTPREGLVLHTVGYEDGDRIRSILYRASLSEMVVPYGDPSPTHYFKNVFDAGENGVGVAVTSLERGCDCLGEIHYFDAAVCDNDGSTVRIPNAICMHEEDFGVLWRHIEWRSGVGEVRRSRRLVLSCFASIGNYDYGFFWYFYQDGSIQYEVKLTGVISTGAVAPGEYPKHGELVAPQLNGMVHQHFFNVRMDMAVDGRRNTVYELESEAVPPGPQNPHGNAWVADRRALVTELAAQRVIDPFAARSWEIANPSRRNRVGRPVAYRLVPGENVLPFAQPGSSVLARAGFIAKHLWVTPYHALERYAGGDFPYQHAGSAGLPEWTKADRSVEDDDIVVWYTFGHHHVPRPEDWPVMPTGYIGFHLKPAGFFDRNPALDVPRTVPHSSCHFDG